MNNSSFLCNFFNIVVRFLYLSKCHRQLNPFLVIRSDLLLAPISVHSVFCQLVLTSKRRINLFSLLCSYLLRIEVVRCYNIFIDWWYLFNDCRIHCFVLHIVLFRDLIHVIFLQATNFWHATVLVNETGYLKSKTAADSKKCPAPENKSRKQLVYRFTYIYTPPPVLIPFFLMHLPSQ